MGADATAAVAVAAQPATHAPVKRLSHQSSGGNSPSVSLSVSVPAGSKVSSYATEEDSVAAPARHIIRAAQLTTHTQAKAIARTFLPHHRGVRGAGVFGRARDVWSASVPARSGTSAQ